jgi:hypothetical protein
MANKFVVFHEMKLCSAVKKSFSDAMILLQEYAIVSGNHAGNYGLMRYRSNRLLKEVFNLSS